MDAFDYIIVGSGSAGSVLASRLSEGGQNTVLLLECGGGDASVYIQMPTALSIPMSMAKYNWQYHTLPEPHLDGRRLHTPRGKVLGGSSSINGMVYVRGHALDFDGWRDAGATGWSYADVLPYFRRAEHRAEGGDDWRGGDGPLHTSYGDLSNPLYRAFIDAGRQAGYGETGDINGFRQEGFGRMDRTIHNGRRWSVANAYLKPAMKRTNLSVRQQALATRIRFEGQRAVGVDYLKGGINHSVSARREVIVAGGPINSPQLLKLSGIGPAQELRGLNIPMVADRPGVGENLQDHLEFYFQVACTQPITLFSKMTLPAKGRIGVRWMMFQDGLGATNHFESCGFIRSRAGVSYPDIQFHFLPAAISYDGTAIATQHGYQAHVGPMRSKSRGFVRLASGEARDKPLIQFNYMSHAQDWDEMRACVRLTREIFGQAAFDPYRGAELSPGADVTTDEAIDAFIRAKVESAYHPCGTCRMGAADDPLAVVDPHTRVIGVEGLRVVDSSIIPAITNGNLNAPTIMIGEKAADHILGRQPLPPADVAVYDAPEWQTRQRQE